MVTFRLCKFDLKELLKETPLITNCFTRTYTVVQSQFCWSGWGSLISDGLMSVCSVSCGLNGIGWPSDFSLDDLAVLHWSLILHQVILGLLSRQSQRWGEQDLLRPTFRISTFISSALSGQSKSQGQLRFKQWGNELSINGEAEKSNYKGYGYRRKGEFGLFCNRSTIDFILMSGT